MNALNGIKEVVESAKSKFADSPLGKKAESFEKDKTKNYDAPLGKDARGCPEKCKTDDNGTIYSINEKLLPNKKYCLNGNVYTTDCEGRIKSLDAKPIKTPENSRDNDAQIKAGGEDRRPDDQGGHILARNLNGDSGNGNLVAMNPIINQSDYKRMENRISDALGEGRNVTVRSELYYSGHSKRPDRIDNKVTIDGRNTVYKFDNNMDNLLKNEMNKNEKAVVKSTLKETKGVISSIKEEYDNNGVFFEKTYDISYKGQDGKNYRTQVVVDNVTGGKQSW